MKLSMTPGLHREIPDGYRVGSHARFHLSDSSQVTILKKIYT